MADQQLRQLAQAAQGGNRVRAEQLLAGVQNLNKLVDEKAALHLAAENGHVPIVELLLERRADPNFRDANGCTPLMSAIERGQTGAIRTLLRAGTDREAADKNGARALHWAVQTGLTEVTRELIAAGCDKDAKAKFDSSPMHIGARSGHADVVAALIQANANVEALTNQAYTPLHIAAMKGNSDVVRVLTQNDAYVEARSNRKMTPLHMAATQGHKEAVQVLLDANGNPSAQDQDGNKPADLALGKGFAELKAILVAAEQEFAMSGSVAKEGTRFAQALALHPYLPEIFKDEHRDSDLSFRPGDIIKNVVVTGNAWWEGELQGKRGSFPSNFAAFTVQDTVTVKHNYYPTRADEMSIREGDSVQVYEKRKSGWWRGICGGRGGLFPANHVFQEGEQQKKGLSTAQKRSSSVGPPSLSKAPSPLPSSPFGVPKKSGSLPKFGGSSGNLGVGLSTSGGPPQMKMPPPIVGTPPTMKSPPPIVGTPPMKAMPPQMPSFGSSGPKKQNKPGMPKGMQGPKGMGQHNKQPKPSPPAGLNLPPAISTPPQAQLSSLPTALPAAPPSALPAALPSALPSFNSGSAPSGLPSFSGASVAPPASVSPPPAVETPAPLPVAVPPPVQQTFVTPVVSTPPPPRAKVNSLFDDDEMGMLGVEESSAVSPSQSVDVEAPAFDNPSSNAQRAKVIYAYEPQHPGDLALVVGTTIEILKTEGGWWEGKHLGQTGIFPANYVQML